MKSLFFWWFFWIGLLWWHGLVPIWFQVILPFEKVRVVAAAHNQNKPSEKYIKWSQMMDMSSGSCVRWTMTKGWRTCRKQQQSLEASRILQLLRFQEWSYKTILNTHQPVKEVVPTDHTKLRHVKVNPATEISTHGSRTCIPLTKTLIYGTSVFYTWWHSWGYDCTGDTHKLVAVLTLVAHICGLVKMGTFGYLEMVMWSLSQQFPWHILCTWDLTLLCPWRCERVQNS